MHVFSKLFDKHGSESHLRGNRYFGGNGSEMVRFPAGALVASHTTSFFINNSNYIKYSRMFIHMNNYELHNRICY